MNRKQRNEKKMENRKALRQFGREFLEIIRTRYIKAYPTLIPQEYFVICDESNNFDTDKLVADIFVPYHKIVKVDTEALDTI